MKAYVYERFVDGEVWHAVVSDEILELVMHLYSLIKKDVLKSPIRYTKIKFINLIIEGNAALTTKSETLEFPFWHGSAKSFKTCNKKIFFEELEKRVQSLVTKVLDFEAGEMEYQGEGSSKAEEIQIESMRLYAEYPKTEKELANDATKKAKTKKPKNRGTRHRNKKYRKGKR